jgi:hypothetical protein
MSELAPWEEVAKLQKSEIAPWEEVDLEKLDKSDAFKTGLTHSMTAGLAPIAAGAGAALGSTVGDIQSDYTSWKDIPGNAWDAFVEARRKRADEQEFLAQKYPGYYGSGNLVGSVATAPLIPLKALQGATLGQKVIQGAKTGAGLGAGFGAAEAVGSARDIGEAATDIGVGAGAGGTLGAGLTGAVEGGKAGLDVIRKYLANKAAMKATSQGELAGTGAVQGTIRPQTQEDIRKVLRQEQASMAPTSETIAQNEKYKGLGLEPLTPVQQQPKA